MIAILLTLFCLFFIYVDSGNSTTVWVMIGVIALIWFCRMSWIDEAKARINRIDYWSRSGKERAMLRHRWEAEAREEEERGRRKNSKAYEQVQTDRGLTKAGDDWTAGKVSHMNTTYTCPSCGSVMCEDHRVEYSSGTVYVTYVCGKCKKKLPVKVK